MRPGRIDLHLHTTVSDGTLAPADVVREAADRGVTLIAITDHDNADGLAEAAAAARRMGVTLIPGVELSADSESEDVHVLGFFVRAEDGQLQAALRELRDSRNLRNERILQRLRELGAPVAGERVREIARDGSVGRPHIAAALVEAGHVVTRTEAFRRYLARGKAAFVPRKRLSPTEACAIIHGAGGLAAVAHPSKIGERKILEAALAAGMDGIEVYHSDHNEHHVETFLRLAEERGLLVVGGTDSHGPHSDRPTAIGSVTIPEWVGEKMLEAAPGWWRDEADYAGRE